MKRLEVIRSANYTCEDCGKHFGSERGLEAHHCAYIAGRDPWEYDLSLLRCVCRQCHRKRQQLEDDFRIQFGRITRNMDPEELEAAFWDVSQRVALQQTEKYAEAFS